MKQKIILTLKHGRPSTKLVYSKMHSGELRQRRQVFRGKGANRYIRNQYYRVFRNNNPEILIKERETSLENSIVVRWGTREELPTSSSTIIYNTARSIANITNKRRSRELFIDQGVSCPKMVTDNNVTSNDLPIIARPFVHSKGRNFIVLNTIAEFNRHYNPSRYYYSAFVDKDSEFRIHTAHGKVLAVMQKNAVEGSIAWNRAVTDSEPFDYVPWSAVDERGLKPILIEAIKAVKAVGADFGGVDVIVKEGTPYVLEVNSAPTLNSSDYVAGRWAQYMDWLFRSETRREHWDVLNKVKGSSLIWKNFQLNEDTQ
jgi:hypothetical protein